MRQLINFDYLYGFFGLCGEVFHEAGDYRLGEELFEPCLIKLRLIHPVVSALTRSLIEAKDALVHQAVQEVDDGSPADGLPVQILVHVAPDFPGYRAFFAFLPDVPQGFLLVVPEDLGEAVAIRVEYQCQFNITLLSNT